MNWTDIQVNQLVDATRADPKLRVRLGSDLLLWEALGSHIEESLLLIANLSATLEGNKLASECQIPEKILKSGCADKKAFWTSLSNCCQLTPLEEDKVASELALKHLSEFPNPILQLATAQVRGKSRNWYELISTAAKSYGDWHAQELPTADIFDNLVSAALDFDLLPLLPNNELNFYKVLDSVVYARNAPVPLPLVEQLKEEFSSRAKNAQSLFTSRRESDWQLFILYMELLTNMAQNDPKVKLVLADLIPTLCDFLNSCKQLPNYNKLSSAPSELRAQDFPMLRSGALGLFAQIIVQQAAAQDQFRECGGLALALEACVIDANNPYLKERAIICVRYALENNAKSQEFVASLEQRQPVGPEMAGKEIKVVDGQLRLK